MEITLKSRPLKVIEIVKGSKARMFENVEIGDILQITVPVREVGRTSRSSRTVDFEILNLSKPSERTYKTLNQLPNILKNFKLEEL